MQAMRRSVLAAILLIACSSVTLGHPTPLPTDFTLILQEVASGLNAPVYATSPTGDARLFIVEQPGRIRIVQGGALLATPFLDIAREWGPAVNGGC